MTGRPNVSAAICLLSRRMRTLQRHLQLAVERCAAAREIDGLERAIVATRAEIAAVIASQR